MHVVYAYVRKKLCTYVRMCTCRVALSMRGRPAGYRLVCTCAFPPMERLAQEHARSCTHTVYIQEHSIKFLHLFMYIYIYKPECMHARLHVFESTRVLMHAVEMHVRMRMPSQHPSSCHHFCHCHRWRSLLKAHDALSVFLSVRSQEPCSNQREASEELRAAQRTLIKERNA
jgi:hypothetical protein